MQKTLTHKLEQGKKIFNGASALKDFFETLILRENKNLPIDTLVKKLSSEYNLTTNQITKFNEIANRTKRARSNVKYIEDKFNANSDGEIEEAERIISELFPKKDIRNIDITANSYNIGLGTFRSQWNYSDSHGYTLPQLNKSSISKEIIEYPSIETIIKNNILSAECKRLIIHMPDLNSLIRRTVYQQNNTDISELEKIPKDTKKLHKEIISHEIRHVIDGIILNSSESIHYLETPPHLYAGGENVFEGFQRDEEEIYEEYEKNKEKLLASKNYNKTHILKNNSDLKIKKYTNTIDKLRECSKLVKECNQTHYKAISYIFSSFSHDWNKIHSRLEYVLEYTSSLK